jgi:hypothetical protein
MAVLSIEALLPSSGAVPSNGYDPLSLAPFTEWEIGDEARFPVVIPETYIAENNFFLRIQESSATPSKRHRWEVRTRLLRPGENATDEQTGTEVFNAEYLSSVGPSRLTTRTFAVTGAESPGRLNGVSFQAGDLLSFTLARIPASTDEDPAAVRMWDLSVTVRVDDLSVSDCAGRVGNIFDTVKDLFNESTGGFLPDSFILRSINRCQQDLAQDGYWREETWIPCIAGESTIDLLSEIPRYQDLHQLRFSGKRTAMRHLGSFRELEELQAGSSSQGMPEYYVVQNGNLHVWPPPGAGLQSGFCVYHSYLPEDLTCSDINPNPQIPRAHDMVFVYFVLKQAFLRDRHAPGADTKFAEYSQLYEAEKRSLLGEGDPPMLSVRPGR